MAKSKKTTKALEAKAAKLRKELADLAEEANALAAKIERAPTATIERGKTKFVVSKVDDYLYGALWNTERLKGLVVLELGQVESLLHPKKGRSEEAIYDQAYKERLANPNLTVRKLAEKYFPEHFANDPVRPNGSSRAASAMKMMEQGLRRARKRATPLRNDARCVG